jgi:hypothetical protein
MLVGGMLLKDAKKASASSPSCTRMRDSNAAGNEIIENGKLQRSWLICDSGRCKKVGFLF